MYQITLNTDFTGENQNGDVASRSTHQLRDDSGTLQLENLVSGPSTHQHSTYHAGGEQSGAADLQQLLNAPRPSQKKNWQKAEFYTVWAILFIIIWKLTD